MTLDLALTIVILGLALWAALLDIAARAIPNRIPAAMAAMGLLLRVHQGQALWAAVAFVAVFGLAFLAWRRGWMGGGDVKLFAAAALAVPPGTVPGQILLISIAGGVLALAYLVLRRVVPRPARLRPGTRLRRILRCEQWRIRRGGPLPYACAISAGIALTLLPLIHPQG